MEGQDEIEPSAQIGGEKAWSVVAKELFAQSILTYKKDLGAVAKAIGRPVKECIVYYYRNYKTQPDSGYHALKALQFRRRSSDGGVVDVFGRSDCNDREDNDSCVTCDEVGELFGCDSCDGWYCLECAGTHSVDALASSQEPWHCSACVVRRKKQDQINQKRREKRRAEKEMHGSNKAFMKGALSHQVFPANPKSIVVVDNEKGEGPEFDGGEEIDVPPPSAPESCIACLTKRHVAHTCIKNAMYRLNNRTKKRQKKTHTTPVTFKAPPFEMPATFNAPPSTRHLVAANLHQPCPRLQPRIELVNDETNFSKNSMESMCRARPCHDFGAPLEEKQVELFENLNVELGGFFKAFAWGGDKSQSNSDEEHLSKNANHRLQQSGGDPQMPYNISVCNQSSNVLEAGSAEVKAFCFVPHLVLRPTSTPTELRPALISLDVAALFDPAGVILGRSTKLQSPGGIRLQPSEEDVAAFDPSLSADKVLSRNHTRFNTRFSTAGEEPERSMLEIWVEDLGSMNGTWVDGKKLEPHVARRVEPGVRIQFGLSGFKMDYTVTLGPP
jgi:hypothetical protein